ncbi:MAG: DUF3079 domain-containing protein [Rhodoferax sp.]|nr:DUF3079 domain-containing protein [Rhodoferax sp.]MBP7492269.1 DUF3079 domain-containing protein [Rhodoferax sp.]
MAKKFPTLPPHPERICWGCDKYCAVNDMHCGNGSDRTPHPVELFGEDWREWNQDPAELAQDTPPSPTPSEEATPPCAAPK